MKMRIMWTAGMILAVVAGGFPTPGASATDDKHRQTAVLAGGCFWGLEAVFERVRGVTDVVAGFSGGSSATAHYDIVSTGTTGHAEAVEIHFDPSVVSYTQLLDVYFHVATDPTQLDRQGPDEGSQYRSEIFSTTTQQAQIARAMIARLTAAHAFGAPIVTKIEPLHGFYAAEAYHQHFYDRNPGYPYIVYNDKPKVEALHAQYPQLAKSVDP